MDDDSRSGHQSPSIQTPAFTGVKRCIGALPRYGRPAFNSDPCLRTSSKAQMPVKTFNLDSCLARVKCRHVLRTWPRLASSIRTPT